MHGISGIKTFFVKTAKWFCIVTSVCYFIYGLLSPFETTRTWLYLEPKGIDDSLLGLFILLCYLIKLPYIFPNLIASRAIKKIVFSFSQKDGFLNIVSVFRGLLICQSIGILVLSWVHIIGRFCFWKDSNLIELNFTIHSIMCILLGTMISTQIPYTLCRLHKEKLK